MEIINSSHLETKKMVLQVNETPRRKQRGIYFVNKIYPVASREEFNPRYAIKVVTLFLTVLISSPVFAAKDIHNSSDHPLISRYPNSYISRHSVKDFDRYTIPLSAPYYKTDKYVVEQSQQLEGEITRIVYSISNEVSNYQIYKNYLASLNKPEFEILYTCYEEACNGTAKSFAKFIQQRGMGLSDKALPYYIVAKHSRADEGDTYLVILNAATSGRSNLISVDIIETKQLELGKVTTNADALLSSLDTFGKAEIYDIFFDTGKSDLKSESANAIVAIAKVLQQRPDIHLYVVGHTDDTGRLQFNTKLSEDRAHSVVNQLVNIHNIDQQRLYAAGVGPFAPLANNNNDIGRNKNRRVELIKRLKN